jgi:hypothetical protein
MKDIKKLDEFVGKMRERIAKGEASYGEDAYLHHDLPKEIEEEIVDMCVWSFLMWNKLQKLKKKIESVKE